MKLNQKQRELLATLEFRAAAPAKEIGKLLKLREYTVQYQIRRFRELGLIENPRPVVDMHRLGFVHYFCYLAWGETRTATRAQLLSFLEASPMITWIFEVGAQFHVAFTISAKNPGEVDNFLDSISKKFGSAIGTRAICIQTKFEYLGRRYLSALTRPRLPWQFSVNEASASLEEPDEKIISALATASDTTVRGIAKQTGIPPATVERHIQKLERDKIILGYYYWIDASIFGRSSFIITLKLHHIEPDFWQTLSTWTKNVIDIVMLVKTIGPWDFELLAEVERQEELSAISQYLYRDFGSKIEALQVIPVMRPHRIRSYPHRL